MASSCLRDHGKGMCPAAACEGQQPDLSAYAVREGIVPVPVFDFHYLLPVIVKDN